MNDDPASIWGDAEPVVVKQEATKGDLAAEELVPAPTTSAATSNLAPTKSLSLDDIDAGWGVPSPTVTPAKEKNGLDDSFKQLDLAASEAGEETVTLEVEQSDAVVSEPETLLGAATASSELDNSAPEAQPSVQEPESSSSVLAAAPETKEEAKEETLDFPEESPASPEALPEAAPAPADEPAPAPSTSEPTSKEDDSFPDGDDGFDDFGAVQEGGGGDDDFGDFGDFDEGAAEGFEGAEDFDTEDAASPVNGVTAGVQEKAREVPVLAEAKPWYCLPVVPNSTRESLAGPIRELLDGFTNVAEGASGSASGSSPFYAAAESQLLPDELRQVEGMAQVLVSEESRKLWKELSAVPPVRPIDWTRSRTRRDHLISMGVPVNLDEILPADGYSGNGSNRGSPLPPLALKLDTAISRPSGPSSAPIERPLPKRSQSGLVPGVAASGSGGGPRSQGGSPARGVSPASGAGAGGTGNVRKADVGLGPPPEVDLQRAEELVGITEDQLSLQTLPALRALSRELHSLSGSTSSLLTYHLSLREIHAADAEMYNSMIRDIVAGAATRFSASGRKDDPRRATTIGLGSSTGSPGSGAGAGGSLGRKTSVRVSGAGLNGSRPTTPRPASPAVHGHSPSPRR